MNEQLFTTSSCIKVLTTAGALAFALHGAGISCQPTSVLVTHQLSYHQIPSSYVFGATDIASNQSKLEAIISFAGRLIESQQTMDPEIQNAINSKLWDWL